MGMKGFAPMVFAIVGIIFLFSVMAIIVPLMVLKYHLVIELKETYDYNNAELALLSLVPKKYNGESMYRILAERDTNGFDENMQKSLKENLVLLTNSKCSELTSSSGIIVKPEDCEPAGSRGEIYLFVPYNQKGLVEKIVLVYS